MRNLKLNDGNDSFLPDLKGYYNYYAFGMLQPHRWWESESYRFGYNGVEKENDVTVKGGIAMADFRMYDARVGRWWGVDKIVKPWESPYAAFFNNPINFADPSGLNPNTDTQPRVRDDETGGDGTDAVMPDNSNSGSAIQVTNVNGNSSSNSATVQVTTPSPTTSSNKTASVQPHPNNGKIESPNRISSHATAQEWKKTNDALSTDWLHQPTFEGKIGSIGLSALSHSLYSFSDGVQLSFDNLANRFGLWDRPPIHITGEIASSKDIYYGSVSTFINLAPMLFGRFAQIATVTPATESVIFARGWQGIKPYYGVDAFDGGILEEGSIVLGGLPGQSAFYTTFNDLELAGSNAANLFQSLQVQAHKEFGYRSLMGVYRVKINTPVAFGIVARNPQFGAGGAIQLVIPEWETSLEQLYTIPLIKP